MTEDTTPEEEKESTVNQETLTGLMDANEIFLSFADSAKGFQAQLVERGWPEEAAQKHGSQVLAGFINHAFAVMLADTQQKPAPQPDPKQIWRDLFGR